jgi:crossover junction endodeoxyribonuclease RuvC
MVAVEDIFFFKNLKTVIKVSQARGVILLTAAKMKIPIFECTPLQIKLAVTSYGRAEKNQVQKMVKTLLGLKEIPRPDDAADALATAICCAHTIKNY